MTERHVATRSCIGCRQRAARHELERYVLARDEGTGATCVVHDPARSAPGRGAWLHDDEQCRQQAVRRRAFRRTLRIDGDVELVLDVTPGNDGVGHVTSPN